MENKLKIGNTVNWRGSFGKGAPKEAKVIGIEITKGAKYGDKVTSTDWSNVKGRNVVISLDNSHWCYGSQITQIR